MIPLEYEQYITIHKSELAADGNGWCRTWYTVEKGVIGEMKVEFGLDDAVDNGEISWSKGRCDDLTSAGIIHEGMVYTMHGNPFSSDPKEAFHKVFWQSDDYLSLIGSRICKRIKRRLQMKVDEGWLALEIFEKSGDYRVYLSDKKI